jgi:hypothetical protein
MMPIFLFFPTLSPCETFICRIPDAGARIQVVASAISGSMTSLFARPAAPEHADGLHDGYYTADSGPEGNFIKAQRLSCFVKQIRGIFFGNGLPQGAIADAGVNIIGTRKATAR